MWRLIGLCASAVVLAATGPSAAIAATASSVSTGFGYSCALSGGKVYCWGTNARGQLGDGYVGEVDGNPDPAHAGSEIASQVVGLSDVTQISAGYDSACAVTGNGDVHCWGNDDYGQLGDGTYNATGTPVTVKGLSGVSSVSAGEFATCASTSTGRGYCWGSNNFGNLGDGTTTDRIGSSTPVAVSGLSGVSAISVGGAVACAVAGGAAKCWGDDDFGELGNDGADDTTCNFGGDYCSLTPVDVTGLSSGVSAISVSIGHVHVCAVATGHVSCWGDNTAAALGDGFPVGQRECYPPDARNLEGRCSTTPEQVAGLSGELRVSAGDYSTCATTGSELDCWGINQEGQTGDGTATGPQYCDVSCATTPVPVTAISGITDVGTGWGSACAITNGDVACWGDNQSGQLGDDSDSGPQRCDIGPDPNNPGSDAYAACSTSPVFVDGFGAPLPPPSKHPGSPSSRGAPRTSLSRLHTHGDTARLTVSCSGGSTGDRCRVRLKLTALVTEVQKQRRTILGHSVTLGFKVKKTIIVGRKLVEVLSGHAKRVRVGLSRAGRRALNSAHRLRATATFTIGQTTTVRHLTFKLPH